MIYSHPEPGGIPYDGVPDEKVVSISLALAIVFFILATSGILFAMACIVFNFVYRERMWVWMNSLKLSGSLLVRSLHVEYKYLFIAHDKPTLITCLDVIV